MVCSLCMMQICAEKWMSESGDAVLCQCAEQTASRQGNDSMSQECWATKVGEQRFDSIAIGTQSKPKR